MAAVPIAIGTSSVRALGVLGGGALSLAVPAHRPKLPLVTKAEPERQSHTFPVYEVNDLFSA